MAFRESSRQREAQFHDGRMSIKLRKSAPPLALSGAAFAFLRFTG
jgi:hypothetical protein